MKEKPGTMRALMEVAPISGSDAFAQQIVEIQKNLQKLKCVVANDSVVAVLEKVASSFYDNEEVTRLTEEAKGRKGFCFNTTGILALTPLAN